jgi:hypothetical protein
MADTTFCDSNVPDYVARECGTDYAGVVGIGLVATDETPTDGDLESAEFWLDGQDASPQKIYVIPNTRGEYTGGSPTEEDGFGLENTRVTGADHAAVVEVEGLKENRNFWEGANRRKWKVALVTAAGLLLWIDVPASVYAKINNQRSIKNMAFWAIDIKWQSFSNPKVLTAPEGVFTV